MCSRTNEAGTADLKDGGIADAADSQNIYMNSLLNIIIHLITLHRFARLILTVGEWDGSVRKIAAYILNKMFWSAPSRSKVFVELI